MAEIEFGTSYLTAGGRMFGATARVSVGEWIVDRDGVLRRIAVMLDHASDAAAEEHKQASFAAGPKGKLP